MNTKLYYTKSELMNIPHKQFTETETNLMFLTNNSQTLIYKKLYLLEPNSPEPKEIYTEYKTYLIVKDKLTNATSRYLNEFNGYIFFNIKDMLEQFEYANNHKLF